MGTQGASYSHVRAPTVFKEKMHWSTTISTECWQDLQPPQEVSPNNERPPHRRKPGKNSKRREGRGRREGERGREGGQKREDKGKKERDRGGEGAAEARRRQLGEVPSKDEGAEAGTDGDSAVRRALEDRPRVLLWRVDETRWSKEAETGGGERGRAAALVGVPGGEATKAARPSNPLLETHARAASRGVVKEGLSGLNAMKHRADSRSALDQMEVQRALLMEKSQASDCPEGP